MAEGTVQQGQTHTMPPAGSGVKAAKTKKEEGTPLTDEFVEVEGKVEDGKYTAEELSEQVAARQIPIRDRRAYLLDQARRNEAVNDEVNARETDRINAGRDAMVLVNDPDQIRENSLQSSLADLDFHTPEGERKLMASRDAIAKARQEAGNPTPVPGGAKMRPGLDKAAHADKRKEELKEVKK